MECIGCTNIEYTEVDVCIRRPLLTVVETSSKHGMAWHRVVQRNKRLFEQHCTYVTRVLFYDLSFILSLNSISSKIRSLSVLFSSEFLFSSNFLLHFTYDESGTGSSQKVSWQPICVLFENANANANVVLSWSVSYHETLGVFGTTCPLPTKTNA